MGSFSTSLSGVEAASQDLSVISNNLANLDTTGYKDQEANFQDFFYQMLGTDGAGDPTQIGAGSVIESVTSAFTEGTISSTGVPTDMAIQGDGFFVVQDGTSTLYTRAGDFSQNNPGYLVTSDGGYVLGYPAVNGVISPSQTLAPLQISSGQVCAPNATTNIELTMNLDASGATEAAATGTLTATGNASAGDTVTIGGTIYTFVTSLSANSSVPDQVVIGSGQGAEATTLANLAAAINGTQSNSQGPGNTYSTGTVANTEVTATSNGTAGTVTITAINPGSEGNNIATTVSLGSSSTFGASFGGSATLQGGVDGADFSEPVVVYDSLGNSHTVTFDFTKTSAATGATGTLTATGNASAGDTITIGGTAYTFVTSLSTNPTVPNQVLISSASTGAEAATLANLAAAINGQGVGTTCSTGTVANGNVTATSNGTAGTVSLTATNSGADGDDIATTVNLSKGSTFGASFGANTLTGGADNAWTYQITLPAADEGGTGSPIVLNSGTLQFDGNGNLVSPTTNVTGINLTNLADGASPMSLTWELSDPTTGAAQITQVAGQSNVSAAEQNGYTSGALQSFTISADGTIQGVFSNGQTLTLGQVALATFQNMQGLQLNGSNMFLATPAAGIPSIGAPNSGGRGSIVGQSLEASNVDMTTELSNLIVAERDYQSNARAISTADQMLNYVLTMQP